MKTLQFCLLSLSIFLFVSCQKESVEIIQDDTTQNITATSSLGSLIARVSQNPTSKDNVLDNSNCFSVQLPVTVIVNNQQIVVATAANYQTVQNAINAFNNDDDIVNFVYPITIKYQNFDTEVIQNVAQLQQAMQQCGDDNDDDAEIDCVKINYPVSFNIYNANQQITSVTTINSNAELFNFLINIPYNYFIALNFPVSVTNPNGQVVSINNNAQLEEIIENAVTTCYLVNGGTALSNNYTVPLTYNSTWRVTYASNDNVVNTDYYEGYNFTFNTDLSSKAVKSATIINGSWTGYTDYSSPIGKLVLSFEGSTLNQLEKDWKIIEFGQTIKLKHGNGDNSSDYLNLTKN
jgi:hypothetical protein